MIRTKYNVSIDIDDTSYSVVVCEPKKDQVEELKKISQESMDAYKKRKDTSDLLREKIEEYEINKELLKEVKLIDKMKLLLEQKSLNKEIADLQRKLDEQDIEITNINEMTENVLKKRFELVVSGEGKASLQKEIDDKNIPYKVIFESIGKNVLEDKEKK